MILPLWRDYNILTHEKRQEIFAKWCDHKGYKHDENLYGEEFVDSIPENMEEVHNAKSQ